MCILWLPVKVQLLFGGSLTSMSVGWNCGTLPVFQGSHPSGSDDGGVMLL